MKEYLAPGLKIVSLLESGLLCDSHLESTGNTFEDVEFATGDQNIGWDTF